MPVTFDSGISGRLSFGTANHLTARITRWMVRRAAQIKDVSGFGDDGQSRFGEGKRRYDVAAVGISRGTVSIVKTGTVQVWLGHSTGTARYSGVVFYSNLQHNSDYNSGASNVSFSGPFDGDPTVP